MEESINVRDALVRLREGDVSVFVCFIEGGGLVFHYKSPQSVKLICRGGELAREKLCVGVCPFVEY